jgi:hypothetical protein
MRSRRVLVAVAAKLRGAFLLVRVLALGGALLLATWACPPCARAQLSNDDDDFAYGYEFEPGFLAADDIPAWERSGPIVSIGIGGQYAGFGLQVAYEWVHPCRGFSLAPYASVGLYPGLIEGEHADLAFAAGVLASYGARNRWLLDFGAQPIASATLRLGGAIAAERPLYGPALQVGRQWMGASGIFFRLLAGAGYAIDPYIAGGLYFALSLGAGWKP